MGMGDRSPLHNIASLYRIRRSFWSRSICHYKVDPAWFDHIDHNVRMRMHSACFTFLLGKVRHSRCVVFGENLEIVRAHGDRVLSPYIEGCQSQRRRENWYEQRAVLVA